MDPTLRELVEPEDGKNRKILIILIKIPVISTEFWRFNYFNLIIRYFKKFWFFHFQPEFQSIQLDISLTITFYNEKQVPMLEILSSSNVYFWF